MRVYAQKDIGTIFKVSLFEFMDKPMDIVQIMISIADEIINKKKSTLEDVENSLKNK